MFEKKGFFLVDDPEVKLRLIREAVKSACPATVWTQTRATVFRTLISSFDLSSGVFRAAIPKELSLEKVLSLIGSRDGIFFNIELPSTHIFFRAFINNYDQGKDYLELKLPEEVYKIQQRKYPRVDTRKDAAIRAYHDDPLQSGRMIRRKVLDLSAGGMALQLFFGEERHYRVGQKITPFQLHIGSKIINCWASVQNIRVVNQGSKKGELIMGVELQGLDETQQKPIKAYIDQKLASDFSSMISQSDETKDDPEKKSQ